LKAPEDGLKPWGLPHQDCAREPIYDRRRYQEERRLRVDLDSHICTERQAKYFLRQTRGYIWIHTGVRTRITQPPAGKWRSRLNMPGTVCSHRPGHHLPGTHTRTCKRT